VRRQGKGILNSEGGRPYFSEDKFEVMLRLQDGELSDTSTMWPTPKCVLRNSIVSCSVKSVRADGPVEVKAYISRETGEYNLFIEHLSTGKSKGNLKIHRFGICRQVSKPIF
jgi:hypothetical protein